MTEFLSAMRSPDGGVPLFNDGFPISQAYLSFLARSERRGESDVFPDSGFARLAKGDWTAFVDLGTPPKGAPGHSHAGILGCWIFNKDTLVVSEAGTSTYDVGEVRDYERSTRAHSTLSVDGKDSLEVWGSFRAGRAPRSVCFECSLDAAADGANTVSASHDGYRFLPGRPRHDRRIEVSGDFVNVFDSVTGLREDSVADVAWHLSGDVIAAGVDYLSLSIGVRVEISGGTSWSIQREHRAVAFERREERNVLRIRLASDSTEVRTTFTQLIPERRGEQSG